MWIFLNILLKGILDSLKIWYPIHLIIRSSRIRTILLSSFILNFVIFSVNYLYFVTIFNWYPNFWKTFYWIFVIFVEIPCFGLTTYFNHNYARKLTELIFEKKYENNNNVIQQQRETEQIISEFIYGTMLIYLTQFILIIVNVLIEWNALRTIISYFGYSWLMSYYLFEPRMIYKKYALHQRISFFHHRWLYFLGYGSIWGIMYILYPYRILYSVYYFIMNLLILNTINLNPSKYDYIESIPIFGLTGSLTNYILLQFSEESTKKNVKLEKDNFLGQK
jgi:hypothetical protein